MTDFVANGSTISRCSLFLLLLLVFIIIPSSTVKTFTSAHIPDNDPLSIKASASEHYNLDKKMRDRKLTGKEFEETTVQKLWDLALNADFTREEIESIRDELTHYQNRVKKLRFFEEQLNAERFTDKETVNISEDDAKLSEHIKRKVKELNYKVDKVHNNLVDRILKRHNEL